MKDNFNKLMDNIENKAGKLYNYIDSVNIENKIEHLYNYIRPKVSLQDTKTPIKHVVFLMLENRSFDQIFGYRNDFPRPFKVNGIENCNSLDETKRSFNLDKDGNKVYLNPMDAFTGHDDSTHDLHATLCCINGLDGKENEQMSGFIKVNQLMVKDSENSSNTIPALPSEIMSYFPCNSFPVFEYIANNFIICDNWFASAPTCTQPNRAFALCGQSDGHIDNKTKGINPKLFYNCDTIFDRLNDKNLPWKVYYNDLPSSLLLDHQICFNNLKNYEHFRNFASDIESGTLPVFSFIEPEYGFESSSKKICDVNNGQTLVKNIIESLQSNSEIWNSTLFVISYDECGGYYDHVYPPKAISPNKTTEEDSYAFDQYGCRVPAMLISPRIPRGVDGTMYDHTSVLSFIEYNWDIEPLTDRDRNANNFSHLINNKIRNIDLLSKTNLKFESAHETTLRNRGMVDDQFLKTFSEYNLIHLISDDAEVLYNSNKELHTVVSNIVGKFSK